jgi:hypothetical protein
MRASKLFLTSCTAIVLIAKPETHSVLRPGARRFASGLFTNGSTLHSVLIIGGIAPNLYLAR